MKKIVIIGSVAAVLLTHVFVLSKYFNTPLHYDNVNVIQHFTFRPYTMMSADRYRETVVHYKKNQSLFLETAQFFDFIHRTLGYQYVVTIAMQTSEESSSPLVSNKGYVCVENRVREIKIIDWKEPLSNLTTAEKRVFAGSPPGLTIVDNPTDVFADAVDCDLKQKTLANIIQGVSNIEKGDLYRIVTSQSPKYPSKIIFSQASEIFVLNEESGLFEEI